MAVGNEELMQMYTSIFEKRRIRKFPGALPTTVTKKNKILLHYGFLVTLKADGVRCFAIINQNKLHLHRRDGAITTFDLPTTFNLHIFDCEFVESNNLLLIFDTLVYKEHPSYRLSLEQRSELANFFLCKIVPKEQQKIYAHTTVNVDYKIEPIPSNYKTDVTWQLTDCGLKIQNKLWYNFHDAETLWKYRNMVPYATDGLIFGRLLCVYSPFSENPESVFKWKPDITIDFMMFRIRDQQRQECDIDSEILSLLEEKGTMRQGMNDLLHPRNESRANYRLFTRNEHGDYLCVTRCNLEEDIQGYNDRKVGEFRWDRHSEQWCLELIRDDKHQPNNLTTTIASLNSILDNLSVLDLIT